MNLTFTTIIAPDLTFHNRSGTLGTVLIVATDGGDVKMKQTCDLRADPRHLLPLLEAARHMGVKSKGKAYEMVRAGTFPVPVLPVGKRMRVRRVDLLRYLGLDPEALSA